MLANFRTYQIARELYLDVKDLKLEPNLKNQLLRCSSSIALNLAEGSGKRTMRDKRKFYTIAFGSFRETQACLELSMNMTYERRRQVDKLGAHLRALLRHFEEVS